MDNIVDLLRLTVTPLLHHFTPIIRSRHLCKGTLESLYRYVQPVPLHFILDQSVELDILLEQILGREIRSELLSMEFGTLCDTVFKLDGLDFQVLHVLSILLYFIVWT